MVEWIQDMTKNSAKAVLNFLILIFPFLSLVCQSIFFLKQNTMSIIFKQEIYLFNKKARLDSRASFNILPLYNKIDCVK